MKHSLKMSKKAGLLLIWRKYKKSNDRLRLHVSATYDIDNNLADHIF